MFECMRLCCYALLLQCACVCVCARARFFYVLLTAILYTWVMVIMACSPVLA